MDFSGYGAQSAVAGVLVVLGTCRQSLYSIMLLRPQFPKLHRVCVRRDIDLLEKKRLI